MNDALTERIEQLLDKHAVMLQTNQMLELECASLRNRLALASQRLELLIAKLPALSPSLIEAAPDYLEPAL